ncbi:recombinase family protein [Halapricum desulfuricans]|nr:recombinase family protein [Halapricum desulfuricans]
MDKTPIGGLSISIICGAYILLVVWVRLPDNLALLTWTLPLGSIYGTELADPKFGLLARSSTDKNDNSAPRDHQLDAQYSEVDRVDGTIEKEVSVVESAATMDREGVNELLRAARKGEINILSAMEVDRITRAPVFEAHKFYNKLRNLDCKIYAGSIGYVDWDDINDVHNLLNQTVFARKWFLRLKEGAKGSVEQSLSEGKYPFGNSNTPFGFHTDSDHNIHVKESEREIIYRAFKTFLRTKNRSETLRRINEKRRKEDDDELSDTNLKSLLESRLCVGQLDYKGHVVSTKPEIQVVDIETFRRAQNILQQRRGGEDHPDFPQFINRAVDRYGLDYLHDILGSLSACRECNGELSPNGGEKLMGHWLQTYDCDSCGHQGPLLTEKEIQELHQTAALSCPKCQSVERFDVSEADWKERYCYSCGVCGFEFYSGTSPHKIKRGFEDSVTRFDIDLSLMEKLNSDDSDPEESRRQETLSGFGTS